MSEEYMDDFRGMIQSSLDSIEKKRLWGKKIQSEELRILVEYLSIPEYAKVSAEQYISNLSMIDRSRKTVFQTEGKGDKNG